MIFSALSNRNYIFLLLGFFTCGFHMAILETHFFNQLLSFNFTRETAALIFSVYGLLTMIGSTLSAADQAAQQNRDVHRQHHAAGVGNHVESHRQNDA